MNQTRYAEWRTAQANQTAHSQTETPKYGTPERDAWNAEASALSYDTRKAAERLMKTITDDEVRAAILRVLDSANRGMTPLDVAWRVGSDDLKIPDLTPGSGSWHWLRDKLVKPNLKVLMQAGVVMEQTAGELRKVGLRPHGTTDATRCYLLPTTLAKVQTQLEVQAGINAMAKAQYEKLAQHARELGITLGAKHTGEGGAITTVEVSLSTLAELLNRIDPAY